MLNINEDSDKELSKLEINKSIKIYIGTDEFKSKINLIVKNKLKDDKEIEDKMVAITKDVLAKLYKTLWTKRGVLGL